MIFNTSSSILILINSLSWVRAFISSSNGLISFNFLLYIVSSIDWILNPLWYTLSWITSISASICALVIIFPLTDVVRASISLCRCASKAVFVSSIWPVANPWVIAPAAPAAAAISPLVKAVAKLILFCCCCASLSFALCTESSAVILASYTLLIASSFLARSSNALFLISVCLWSISFCLLRVSILSWSLSFNFSIAAICCSLPAIARSFTFAWTFNNSICWSCSLINKKPIIFSTAICSLTNSMAFFLSALLISAIAVAPINDIASLLISLPKPLTAEAYFIVWSYVSFNCWNADFVFILSPSTCPSSSVVGILIPSGALNASSGAKNFLNFAASSEVKNLEIWSINCGDIFWVATCVHISDALTTSPLAMPVNIAFDTFLSNPSPIGDNAISAAFFCLSKYFSISFDSTVNISPSFLFLYMSLNSFVLFPKNFAKESFAFFVFETILSLCVFILSEYFW